MFVYTFIQYQKSCIINVHHKIYIVQCMYQRSSCWSTGQINCTQFVNDLVVPKAAMYNCGTIRYNCGTIYLHHSFENESTSFMDIGRHILYMNVDCQVLVLEILLFCTVFISFFYISILCHYRKETK